MNSTYTLPSWFWPRATLLATIWVPVAAIRHSWGGVAMALALVVCLFWASQSAPKNERRNTILALGVLWFGWLLGLRQGIANPTIPLVAVIISVGGLTLSTRLSKLTLITSLIILTIVWRMVPYQHPDPVLWIAALALSSASVVLVAEAAESMSADMGLQRQAVENTHVRTLAFKERASASRETSEAIFSHLQELVLVTDAAGHIGFANPMAIRTIGLDDHQLIGSSIVTLLTDPLPGRGDEITRWETSIHLHDGKTLSVLMTRGHFGGEKLQTGYVFTATRLDTTKAAEMTLRNAQMRATRTASSFRRLIIRLQRTIDKVRPHTPEGDRLSYELTSHFVGNTSHPHPHLQRTSLSDWVKAVSPQPPILHCDGPDYVNIDPLMLADLCCKLDGTEEEFLLGTGSSYAFHLMITVGSPPGASWLAQTKPLGVAHCTYEDNVIHLHFAAFVAEQTQKPIRAVALLFPHELKLFDGVHTPQELICIRVDDFSQLSSAVDFHQPDIVLVGEDSMSDPTFAGTIPVVVLGGHGPSPAGASGRIPLPIPIDGLARLIAQHRLARMRVMVVDDDPTVRTLIRHLLANRPYVVFEAINGFEALRQIAQTQPDLILLDLAMPTLDGFAFLDVLRSLPEWKDLPVIVVTGRSCNKELLQRLSPATAIQKSQLVPNLEAHINNLLTLKSTS